MEKILINKVILKFYTSDDNQVIEFTDGSTLTFFNTYPSQIEYRTR